jgi:hypothetical protein
VNQSITNERETAAKMITDRKLLPVSAWWQTAEWVLFGIWIADAIAVMMHIRGGVLTSHAADLALPPWLYIILRRQYRGLAGLPMMRHIVSSALLTGISVFFASCATEVSQYFWPQGLFPGTFDWLDLLCYAIGLGSVSAADLRWNIRRTEVSPKA